MTMTRSNDSATKLMSWLMATTVRPSAASAADDRLRLVRTPCASWPVVGSSSTIAGVPIARIDASASSFRSEKPRSYGFVFGLARQADRLERCANRCVQRVAAQPEVARAEGDFARRPRREDLPVRVLERDADVRASSATWRSANVAAVDQDTAPVARKQAVEVANERGLAGAVLADDRDALAGLDASTSLRRAPACRPGRRSRGSRVSIAMPATDVLPAAASFCATARGFGGPAERDVLGRRYAMVSERGTRPGLPRRAALPRSARGDHQTSSHIRASRSVLCSTISTPMPVARAASASASPTSCVPSGSSCDVGSSRTR